MKKLRCVIAGAIWILSTSAFADLEVILANESDLPYALSPSKYSNSSSNYSNSISKYSNSGSKYSNSSSKYDNSPSKYSNGKSGNQRLLLKKDGSYFYIGYYVWGDDGLINFFSSSGERLFYSPPETDAVFDGDKGEFAGTIATQKDSKILAVTEKGQVALVKSGVSLTQSSSAPTSQAQNSYLIEFAHNDELFVINGEKFQAQTYCLGWEQGEAVTFIEGSAYGACASAELFNLNRKESCSVWCE
ncbi:hypothetical protein OLZ68_002118 [Vibrio vulnificus]|nr:hypothetical protein [Vibrio vulnificus]